MSRAVLLTLLLLLAACTPSTPEEAGATPAGGSGGTGGTAGAGGSGGVGGLGGSGGARLCAPTADARCEAPRTAAFVRLGPDLPTVSLPLCGVPFDAGELIVELFLRPSAVDGERALLAWPADDGTIGLELGLRGGRPVATFTTGTGPFEILAPPRMKLRTDRWQHVVFVVRFPTERCTGATPFAAQFLVNGDAMGEDCVALGGASALGAGFVALGRPVAGGGATLPYEGDLDELRIWAEGALVFVVRERIPRRILSSPDLVGAWDFDLPPTQAPLVCDDANDLHAIADGTLVQLPGGALAPLGPTPGCAEAVRGAPAGADLALCEVAIADRIDGEWTSGVCGPGFRVCRFDDAPVATLPLAAALELPGCFVYDGSPLPVGGCGPCADDLPQLGLGAACRWDRSDRQGPRCLADGALTAYDPTGGSPSCGPVPGVTGIACCRSP